MTPEEQVNALVEALRYVRDIWVVNPVCIRRIDAALALVGEPTDLSGASDGGQEGKP